VFLDDSNTICNGPEIKSNQICAITKKKKKKKKKEEEEEKTSQFRASLKMLIKLSFT
jgi:hypothetical protein